MKKSYLVLLLVAIFALVACDNNDNKPQRSENDIAIDNLMAQCKGFDAEILTQGWWESGKRTHFFRMMTSGRQLHLLGILWAR